MKKLFFGLLALAFIICSLAANHEACATSTFVPATTATHWQPYPGYFTVYQLDPNMIDGNLSTYTDATYYGMSFAEIYMQAQFQTYTGPKPKAVYAVVTYQGFIGSPHPTDAYVEVLIPSGGSSRLTMNNLKQTARVYLGTKVPATVAVHAYHPNSSNNYQCDLMVYEIQVEVDT